MLSSFILLTLRSDLDSQLGIRFDVQGKIQSVTLNHNCTVCASGARFRAGPGDEVIPNGDHTISVSLCIRFQQLEFVTKKTVY